MRKDPCVRVVREGAATALAAGIPADDTPTQPLAVAPTFDLSRATSRIATGRRPPVLDRDPSAEDGSTVAAISAGRYGIGFDVPRAPGVAGSGALRRGVR
ncbi:hypothetical protein FRAAL2790 [Frankia alni ACN14a]|uniref:Uncharacterized protein n=1 Tax=Frankia alni (strain DSM 45986 / CECT 9034 / ACN14a) TaxID=326424 RepID=Q0RM18_FRAAA|nr:hypothetical protein FRAAL2790 [Frankia alni ACN14a]